MPADRMRPQEILPFLETYRQDIVRSEFLDPVESYKTFNEFFYRKWVPFVGACFSGCLLSALVNASFLGAPSG